MTENQWPEDPGYTAPPANTGLPGGRTASTFPDTAPHSGAPQAGDSPASRTDAAKDEAADVARAAKDSAQSVAQTAKEEAANVAAEAKYNAKDLLDQARTGLTSQAGTQQQKAAEGIRTISDQLRTMADAPDQQGMAGDLVRQAADRASTAASWLESRQPGDLLDEVQRFARNRPGTFLLLAAGAGVLAGRLTRGLTAGAPETSANGRTGTAGLHAATPYGDRYTETYTPAGGTVPPPPVQLPGPATTTAGYDGGAPGSGYAEPARPTSPLDSPQLVEEPWSGNRVADDPLRDRDLADDPMAGDPLTRDRNADGQSGRL